MPKATPHTTQKTVTFQSLLAKADASESGPDVYSNHVQLYISRSELILDLFLVLPNTKGESAAKLVKRVYFPVLIGKGLASAVANLVAVYERDNATTLPNLRPHEEDDLITVWNE